MRGKIGPALVHLIEASSPDPEQRITAAAAFLENPQYSGSLRFFNAEMKAAITYLNADPLVDQNVGHVGYQLGFAVKDSIVYEQCEDHRTRHLLRVDFPETVAQAAIGKRLGDLIEGIKRMDGIWTADIQVQSLITIKGATHLVIPVPSIAEKDYQGRGMR